MPRRNRTRPAAGRPLPAGLGDTRAESAGDGEWHLRPVPAARSGKSYRCPGCVQAISPGMPHVVAWPADPGGLAERRHWHTTCWSARHRRRPA